MRNLIVKEVAQMEKIKIIDKNTLKFPDGMIGIITDKDSDSIYVKKENGECVAIHYQPRIKE